MEENPLTATEVAASAVSRPLVCQGCQERDREILRLRKQVGLLEPTGTPRRGVRWWSLSILGLIALILLPSLSLLIVIPVLVYDSDSVVLGVVAQVAIFATPVAQSAIIGVLALLHWRPARQRIPVGLGAAAMIGLTAIPYACFMGGSDSLEFLRVFAPTLPIAMAIACCPVFVARSIYGWTIGLGDQTPPQRSTTVSSYLGAMAFIGAATACLRWTDVRGFEENAVELALFFIAYVAVPSAITGCVLAILAPAVLRRPRWSWKKRAACLASLALVSGIGPLPYLAALAVEADTLQYLSPDEATSFVIGYGLGITAISSVVALAAWGWVRLLGYRLYTKSECVAEEAEVGRIEERSDDAPARESA